MKPCEAWCSSVIAEPRFFDPYSQGFHAEFTTFGVHLFTSVFAKKEQVEADLIKQVEQLRDVLDDFLSKVKPKDDNSI